MENADNPETGVSDQISVFTVRFMYDEDEDIYEDYEAIEGECIEEPEEPEDSERAFIGWFYVDGETGELVEFDFSAQIVGNITLYAVWEDLYS